MTEVEHSINRDDWTGRVSTVGELTRENGEILVSTADFILWLCPVVESENLYTLHNEEMVKLGAVGKIGTAWTAWNEGMEITRDGVTPGVAAARLGFVLI
jgi:hypothetical protein